MEGIRYWISIEGTGHYFLFTFLFCIILLLVLLNGRRIRFVIPSMIITVFIVNPFFYQKWESFGLYSYWRIFWIVPVIPVVAAIVPAVTEKIESKENNNGKIRFAVKAVISVVGTIGVITAGTFLYNGTGGSFVKASNTAKLPDYVVQIADRLLELNDNPKVVVQDPIGVYIRQYTGKIDIMFGRDISGYILKATQYNVYNQLSSSEGNYNAVATVMIDDNYDFLVVDPTDKEEKLLEAGFEEVDLVAGYGIYMPSGKPNVIKQRNEFGQVISVTTVDDNGKPINNELGYATIEYKYDSNGFVIREFRTDVDGYGAADKNGCSGYEREFDSEGRIVMERMIAPDEGAIATNAGYAEIRREYENTYLIKESYYDVNGNLVNRIDTFYAVITMSYDCNGNITEECYYAASGKAVKASSGYARVERVYNDSKIVEERYYDEYDEPVSIAAGYCMRRCIYDAIGNMTSESYFDEVDELTNCINGYAYSEQQYDGDHNIVVQSFYDADGKLIISGLGYAEVHREYEGKHLIREAYFGTDRMPYKQLAGHVAIEQAWDRDTLVSRIYLGADGKPINRVDGYSKAIWKQDDNNTWNVEFYDLNDCRISIDGLNLVQDVQTDVDGWSEWMIPTPNTCNNGFYIGSVNLGEKNEGDVYTCQVEIEFSNVTMTDGLPFLFYTQGPVDGQWNVSNIWYPNVTSISMSPIDGVYQYTSTISISNAQAGSSVFGLGFRCDNWTSGKFRVHNVKIEKSDSISKWSPGL